jgi:crotonobetainyl-CoA:carnitine CoA-transferase CaiB-like acyl-CoA transferase
MKVLELAGGPAAGFAGLFLAELGHEVTKVELPGDQAFDGACSAVMTPTERAFVDRRKASHALDLRTRAGAASFVQLAAGSDAIIEDLGAGALGRLRISPRRLRGANPRLVIASISPFGQSGPKAGWQASELVVQASAGILHSTGWVGETPLKAGGFAAHAIAGLNAATAVLAAGFGLAAGNSPGVHIDVSMQECYLHHWSRHIGEWAHSGTRMRREVRTFGHQGFPHTAMAADGWLYLLALFADWESLALFLGLEPFVTHEWTDPAVRAKRWPEIEAPFHNSIASRSRYEWFAAAAEAGYTFAPIQSPADQLQNPAFTARGFLKQARINDRTVPCPGLPFPWAEPAAPNQPPSKSEHNELLGAANVQ